MSLQSIWDLCTGSTVGTGGDLAVKTLRFLLEQHFLHSAVASPVVHHGQAPSRAARIVHHMFCQGHSWQDMVVRETPIPPPPIELISYCHSVTLPLEKWYQSVSF